jgi:cysteine desulfurase
MRRVYFDHNATTPIHPGVAAFVAGLVDKPIFGNPSSLHWAGREARSCVADAREQIAVSIGAKPGEIVFTGSGSESDNHAIKGVAFSGSKKGNHIITTKVEHPAVLNTCRYLETKGFDVTYLNVDQSGSIDPDDVQKAIRQGTVLITVMYANNETGVLSPIREIAAIARNEGIPFHSDMVQALGKIAVNVGDLGVDLASFSGHKLYAPKGVGCLYAREGMEIENLVHGGHQEDGRRAGTENVIGIAAFGKACEIAGEDLAEESARIEFLSGRLLNGLKARIDDVTLNGNTRRKLPNTLNLSFRSVEGESLLISLDIDGIAVSSGSACSSGSTDPSHVLLAMGIDPILCQSAVRISLGRETTEEDIDYALEVVPRAVERLREMSPLRESRS